ncbi:hypothetical protein HMPREF9470_04888 [[Clostridium] citroniae WAL-19142]|uniref:Uncharacterized protein n=5 Tax=Enterocloster citroniae TaxID=358743 RepID=A0A0J9BPM6_9FIRM|nr:hypothetical protein HMPREF9470_04888 [[Clostridium] citroniae WAL-19142]
MQGNKISSSHRGVRILRGRPFASTEITVLITVRGALVRLCRCPFCIFIFINDPQRNMIVKKVSYMLVKLYTIVFGGLPLEMFTNDSLIEVWLEAARTVYEETGMRVDARLSIPYYICDKYENCNLSGPIANYVCMWEPTELESQEDYYVALLQVVRRVRERLGNPYMEFSSQDSDIHYFFGDLN